MCLIGIGMISILYLNEFISDAMYVLNRNRNLNTDREPMVNLISSDPFLNERHKLAFLFVMIAERIMHG